MQMTDDQILSSLRNAFASGCDFLQIHSQRQDVGLMKCSRGVELGFLRFQETPIDSQETHFRYYWTDKARREWINCQ